MFHPICPRSILMLLLLPRIEGDPGNFSKARKQRQGVSRCSRHDSCRARHQAFLQITRSFLVRLTECSNSAVQILRQQCAPAVA